MNNPTPIVRQLFNRIKDGECVLFLGAGVHAPPPPDSPYAYPLAHRPLLGGDLAERLAEECGFALALPGESLRDLMRVSLFFETPEGGGRNNLVKALERHLDKDRDISPALEMLARLPFTIIVTTNFDRLLESALRRCGKEPQCFVYDPKSDRPTRDLDSDPTSQKPLVFKMHGDIQNPESVVVTDEDYIGFVQRMSDKEALHPVPQTVRFRMKQWPTLFIGYSLRDYNLRLLYRTLRWRVDPSDFPLSYSIDPNPDLLIQKVWQDHLRFISFIVLDLWEFIPMMYRQLIGMDYPST